MYRKALESVYDASEDEMSLFGVMSGFGDSGTGWPKAV